MAGIRIEGNTSGSVAEVNAGNHLQVVSGIDASGAPQNIGGSRIFSENDAGSITGSAELISPESDIDYRLRVCQDIIHDSEEFNYTAQATGKHSYATTTLTNSWTAGQLTTNSGSTTAVNSGSTLSTYAFFPNYGTTTLSADFETSFSALPVANSFVEIGLGIPGAVTAAPSDGVFLRLNSNGLAGVASFNGTETVDAFPNLSGGNAYTPNKRYQFIVYIGQVKAVFWVNAGAGAVKLGEIALPDAQSRMCMASGVQFFIKHRVVGGAAGGVLQSMTGAYSVRSGGASYATTPSIAGSRILGSYQGLSGGTVGSLSNFANSANPTAAVPTNTTAALGVGLGGQFWETDTLAVTTDGIIASYQVPAGTVSIQGRRLVMRGVKIQSYVQTVLTGGGYNAVYSLAFGHTNVSLATTESATAKAPRRIPLGIQSVAANAAALTLLQDVIVDFGDNPVFVNPGEFVAIAKKKVGAAPTAGVIAHNITFIYGWE